MNARFADLGVAARLAAFAAVLAVIGGAAALAGAAIGGGGAAAATRLRARWGWVR